MTPDGQSFHQLGRRGHATLTHRGVCDAKGFFFLQDWEDSSPPRHWDFHRILETGFFWMSQETEAKVCQRDVPVSLETVESCCSCQNDHDSFHSQISMLFCRLVFTYLEMQDGGLQVLWLILLLLHPPPPLGLFSWLAPVFTLFSKQMEVWHCVEGGHYLKLKELQVGPHWFCDVLTCGGKGTLIVGVIFLHPRQSHPHFLCSSLCVPPGQVVNKDLLYQLLQKLNLFHA